MAKLEGDRIVFLLHQGAGAEEARPPLSFESDLAEPMRRGLSGKSGTLVGLDYRGDTVLAAHEPVAGLGWAIVAKIELAEIRAPFIEAGMAATLGCALVVAIAGFLSRRLANPMVKQLQVYAEGLEVEVAERTRELREAQDHLVRQEKLAVLGQLAGGVGHELRNPLGVINNAVYYLQMVLPDADETTREYLGIISAEVQGAEKIVSDLLDFSRIKALDRDSVVVSELVAQSLAKTPPPEGVEVISQIPPEVSPVYVDLLQVRQVLVNLLTNAYQAMPEGGQLHLRARIEADRVALSVTDTGCGIPAANLAKVFEPLFTTKARGIGLGLAVSRNLVVANGGSIEVESEVGKGTTFTVYLPTREVPA